MAKYLPVVIVPAQTSRQRLGCFLRTETELMKNIHDTFQYIHGTKPDQNRNIPRLNYFESNPGIYRIQNKVENTLLVVSAQRLHRFGKTLFMSFSY